MGLLPLDNVNTGTTLIAGTALTPSGMLLQVTPGSAATMPTGQSFMRLGTLLLHDSEVIAIQSISNTADTFNIAQRGVNGVQPQQWPIGTVVQVVGEVSDDTLCESVGSLMSLVGGFAPMQPTLKANTAQALATSGTITTVGLSLTRVNPAAASTAVVLQAGTQDGQLIVVENDSANLITFDVVGNSHVQDGAGDTIAANVSAIFAWNAASGFWSRIKAA